MSQIHFHEDFYIPVLKGSKTQTARIDEACPELGTGTAIFDHGKSIPIEITSVSYKSFDEMSLEEAHKDGFKSKDELWYALLTFYPDLQKSDLLMLVEFKRVVI
ncbi:ASCH domain-containing protein [Labilibaculum sp. A4]|uniref:ASCH domain-containing protein n=1 Tax=Labilibaculum euxinus TaxID=2686357 RepID=A0A425YFE2_9BACT|nr:ASCH domain-containing protein [Labilibaculum euxinus]MDQ1770564.1 ASCH domain-containing protein [Labilibaculum euxinus]MUP39358.1 ASCH domain-containing protein [Labilibaculum euxinus]MVB08563.1 ASCH domain-containing protein [Labilibaculum euxinus]MWN75217.1 ASCH domain-containing protein [Labilibaculum euxinus]